MRLVFRVLTSMLMLAALLATALASASAARPFPDTIALPNGWQPEGVVTGRGPVIYAGSRVGGGIYAADLRTGEGAALVEPETGRVAIGLDFDARTNYIYVAGGGTGTASIYDADSGALVREYALTAAGPGTFINDAIVTREAAYFTDSRQAVLYRIPLGPGGEPADTFEAIPLDGEYQHVPGATNANGIEATPNGEWLIIVNSTTGLLYRVDPATGETTQIDLGGATVTQGDGLLLHGRTLYVVRNRSNAIVVVELAPDLTSGEVVDTISDPRFDVPTTIARFGNALYAVNARFGTPSPDTATYNIVRVEAKP